MSIVWRRAHDIVYRNATSREEKAMKMSRQKRAYTRKELYLLEVNQFVRVSFRATDDTDQESADGTE